MCVKFCHFLRNDLRLQKQHRDEQYRMQIYECQPREENMHMIYLPTNPQYGNYNFPLEAEATAHPVSVFPDGVPDSAGIDTTGVLAQWTEY